MKSVQTVILATNFTVDVAIAACAMIIYQQKKRLIVATSVIILYVLCATSTLTEIYVRIVNNIRSKVE